MGWPLFWRQCVCGLKIYQSVRSVGELYGSKIVNGLPPDNIVEFFRITNYQNLNVANHA